MPQHPAGLSRVARKTASPEPHTGPKNPLPWTGRVGWVGHARGLENRPGTETSSPATAPASGESLPAGPMCRMCRAYPADPEWHEQWHVNLDAWARGVNADIASIQRVLQERGHVPAGAASDGNSERNGHE